MLPKNKIYIYTKTPNLTVQFTLYYEITKANLYIYHIVFVDVHINDKWTDLSAIRHWCMHSLAGIFSFVTTKIVSICKFGFERNLPLDSPNTPCQFQSNQLKHSNVIEQKQNSKLLPWWPYWKSCDDDYWN